MRSHEQELISALVEGRLEDEAEALALIASSDALHAEYEAQKLAYDALSAIPPAQLSDQERAALRRDVWTELQTQPTPGSSTTPWYFRWSTAAAGLFIVVGVLTITNLGGGGSRDTSTEAFSVTTSAAVLAPEEAAAKDGETDDAAEALDADAAGAAGNMRTIPDPILQAFGLISDELRLNDPRFAGTSSSELQALAADHESCLTEAALEGYEVVSEFFDPTVGESEAIATAFLAAVPADQPIGPETPVAYVVLATCTLFYIDE